MLRAQGAGVKIGILQPVTGALAYSGQQGRSAPSSRSTSINAAGGIKGLRQDRAGARRRAIDARGRHRRGREDELGRRRRHRRRLSPRGSASPPRQAAARYDLPYVVDVGVADSIVTRGLKNTFRFGPGFGVIAKTAIDNLVAHQRQGRQAGQDRDDRARGRCSARASPSCSMRSCRSSGFEIMETIPHPTPTRDFNNVVLQDQVAESGHRDPGGLLQRVRAACPHHAAAAVQPKGDLLGARRRRLALQVRQGVPGGRAVHHGLQPLVRPEQREGAGAQEGGRGAGPVLHLQDLHELPAVLLLADAIDARRRRRPRQGDRGARRTRPSRATSCPTARPSSSTARTRAPRRSTPRCTATTSR